MCKTDVITNYTMVAACQIGAVHRTGGKSVCTTQELVRRPEGCLPRTRGRGGGREASTCKGWALGGLGASPGSTAAGVPVGCKCGGPFRCGPTAAAQSWRWRLSVVF